jgi:hypothetical protein
MIGGEGGRKNEESDWRQDGPSLIHWQRHWLETGFDSAIVLVKVWGPEEDLIPCHRKKLVDCSEVFATMLGWSSRNCSEDESRAPNNDERREIIDFSKNPTLTAQLFRTLLRVSIPIPN